MYTLISRIRVQKHLKHISKASPTSPLQHLCGLLQGAAFGAQPRHQRGGDHGPAPGPWSKLLVF